MVGRARQDVAAIPRKAGLDVERAVHMAAKGGQRLRLGAHCVKQVVAAGCAASQQPGACKEGKGRLLEGTNSVDAAAPLVPDIRICVMVRIGRFSKHWPKISLVKMQVHDPSWDRKTT